MFSGRITAKKSSLVMEIFLKATLYNTFNRMTLTIGLDNLKIARGNFVIRLESASL
jgi:hypothetical protein